KITAYRDIASGRPVDQVLPHKVEQLQPLSLPTLGIFHESVDPAVQFQALLPVIRPFISSVFYRLFIVERLAQFRISPGGNVFQYADAGALNYYPEQTEANTPTITMITDHTRPDAYVKALGTLLSETRVFTSDELPSVIEELHAIHATVRPVSLGKDGLDRTQAVELKCLVLVALAAGRADFLSSMVAYLGSESFRRVFVDEKLSLLPSEHLDLAGALLTTSTPSERHGNDISGDELPTVIRQGDRGSSELRQKVLSTLCDALPLHLHRAAIMTFAVQDDVQTLHKYIDANGPVSDLIHSDSFSVTQGRALAILIAAKTNHAAIFDAFYDSLSAEQHASIVEAARLLEWNGIEGWLKFNAMDGKKRRAKAAQLLTVAATSTDEQASWWQWLISRVPILSTVSDPTPASFVAPAAGHDPRKPLVFHNKLVVHLTRDMVLSYTYYREFAKTSN
ncbi:hypothetical protein IWQ60_011245, partial [Tieghemiomyces parasiticus]